MRLALDRGEWPRKLEAYRPPVGDVKLCMKCIVFTMTHFITFCAPKHIEFLDSRDYCSLEIKLVLRFQSNIAGSLQNTCLCQSIQIKNKVSFQKKTWFNNKFDIAHHSVVLKNSAE